MKTFVVENVLEYKSGLIVIKAKNIESAKKLLNKRFDKTFYGNTSYGIRELEDNEIVYIPWW